MAASALCEPGHRAQRTGGQLERRAVDVDGRQASVGQVGGGVGERRRAGQVRAALRAEGDALGDVGGIHAHHEHVVGQRHGRRAGSVAAVAAAECPGRVTIDLRRDHGHPGGLGRGDEALDGRLGRRRVLDAEQPDDRQLEPRRPTAGDEGAETGQARHALGDLASEPGLDVVGIAGFAIGRGLDESLERVVGLDIERRGVLEAREQRQQLGDLLALVTGQVEPDVEILDRGRRQVAGRDGSRARRVRQGRRPDRCRWR